jgi:DNA-3-methyladenine glycosylase I
VRDDRKLFEMLILEGAQAGLSWETILNRRAGYRKAFAGFDPVKVANFGRIDIRRLMADPGIIRNRLKIESSISNARAFLEIRHEFRGFYKWLWRFVDGKPIVNRRRTMRDIPAVTDEAKVLSKELKRRGFRFVGPTIVYAFMQAVGMVNDHTVDCFRYRELR